MFRNYLAAALRNLARSRLYSSISILGLGIGLCGSLLALLVARNQLTQDQFIPGYGQLYQVVRMTHRPGEAPRYSPRSPSRIAALLEERSASVRGASRLMLETGGLQNGDISATEQVYWADPDFFELVQLPVVAGSLATALRQPDGLVLDRSTAQRYFGRDDPVGETLMFRKSALSRALHPMRVTAVIQDLPAEATGLRTGNFASGLAAHSLLTGVDRDPPPEVDGTFFGAEVTTYVRLAEGASIQTVQDELLAVLGETFPSGAFAAALDLVRIDRINQHAGLSPGFGAKLALIVLLGFCILLVAVINFVNLMTARADQRALEVGIRKAAGASRGALVLQFLGEAFAYAVLGMVLAVALVEWSLPYVNSFLNTGATFDYWREPGMLAGLLVAPFMLALTAGAWPALVLSSFRPRAVLAAARQQSRAGGLARQVFVTVQFALLIGLTIAAGVVFQQRHYALTQAMRVDTDQILMVWSQCGDAFVDGLRRIPGVRGLACGGWQWIDAPDRATVRARDGSEQSLGLVPVDLAVFDLYGVKALAGRFTLDEAGLRYPRDPSRYVINEAAALGLGFATAQDAVGQQIEMPPGWAAALGGSQIIAVVPDFSLGLVDKPIGPVAYLFDPGQQYLVSVKLASEDMPATLAEIDRAWAATGAKEPTNRFFLDQRLEEMYLSMLRQAQAIGVFALVAVLLAAFGLFALAAASVARRTREIGIRKALGAQTGDVVGLLLWQFSKPVVWANLIAWPGAGWAMQRWLSGFAYRIDLPLWLFPAAATLALLIALATVGLHALRIAAAKPVASLRSE